MKAKLPAKIAILIISLVIVSFAVYFLFFQPPEKIVYSENIFSEMKNYCNHLQSLVKHSGCPTCFHEMTSCIFVNSSEFELNLNGDICYSEKIGNQSVLSIKRHLIYGRNDRPGSVVLKFNLSENGTILSEDFPEKSCV
jgi:hypothetical protein